MSKAWIAFTTTRVARSYLKALASEKGMELDEFMRQIVKERLHRAGVNVDV